MPTDKRIFKVAIVAPTCFYYQAPLFRDLASNPRIDLTVYFCSDEALKDKDLMTMYKIEGTWGVGDDLLKGYKSVLLRNYSPSPSYIKWPFGLINLGILGAIRRDRPDIVVLMSWMNPTWWLAILTSLRYRIPMFYMTDSNIYRERSNPSLKGWIKRQLLGKGLFRLTTRFLCAGTANKRFYAYHGVGQHKLIPFAFSWGYGTLLQTAGTLKDQRDRIRAEHNIPEDSFVILYCGRLSREKGLPVLLGAYQQISSPETTLVLVGDGNLKQSLLEHPVARSNESVRFLGFQTRTEIARSYAMADVLVLPSLRETWGIVVNEALCFGLPVIVSEAAGCVDDLVHDNYNGFTFREGDEQALAKSLRTVISLSDESRAAMGARSVSIITEWSSRDLPKSLVEHLDSILGHKDASGE